MEKIMFKPNQAKILACSAKICAESRASKANPFKPFLPISPSLVPPNSTPSLSPLVILLFTVVTNKAAFLRHRPTDRINKSNYMLIPLRGEKDLRKRLKLKDYLGFLQYAYCLSDLTTN